MFSSVPSGSVKHISIYEYSGSKVFKNIKFLGEISNNSPYDLLGTNAYKPLESCW